MNIVNMVMPQMGESIMECTVLSWLKQPGDKVEADEAILEVATDKVDAEVPSPFTGTILEILVNEGDVIKIGNLVAKIQAESTDTQPLPDEVSMREDNPENLPENAEVKQEVLDTIEQHMAGYGLPTLTAKGSIPEKMGKEDQANNGFFSPLVLSMAREENVSREELLQIDGTGAESRVTKKDLAQYISNRISDTPPTQPLLVSTSHPEVVEMDRMRKMIAARMKESQNISAHVTSFIETDMTPIVQWRERIKKDFRQQTGSSITFTPLLIEAVVKAIKDYPLINISVEGSTLLIKKDINIGMAVALPNGNLIVPVIHKADQYNLIGLTKKVNDLATRARENKLKADDLAGGTYTISNIGSFGNLMGTPIIVQPQVAIMAFGAIKKKPAVVETPQGDLLGVKQLMYISHSYDHRVVDGSLGGLFLKRVSDNLENFDTKRPII